MHQQWWKKDFQGFYTTLIRPKIIMFLWLLAYSSGGRYDTATQRSERVAMKNDFHIDTRKNLIESINQ